MHFSIAKGDISETFRIFLQTLRVRNTVRSRLVVTWAVELCDLNPKIHLTLKLSVYFFSFS